MSRKEQKQPDSTSVLLCVVIVCLAILVSYLSRHTGLPWWAAAALIAIPTVTLYRFASRKINPPEIYIPREKKPIVINTQADLDAFYQKHHLAREIKTEVVGVTYPNHEHVSRQALIPKCHKGDPVSIVFYRYYGEPAYFVFAECGEIGNLNRKLAAELYKKYGRRTIFRAEIDSVTGGDRGYYYGCNICIEVYV